MMLTRRIIWLLLLVAMAAPARTALAQSAAFAPPAPPAGAQLPPSAQGALTPAPLPPESHEYRPHIVIELELGMETGGDDLGRPANYGATGLKAGDGALITAGGTFTPLWLQNRVGLGVGFNFGYKYNALSGLNGGPTFSRYPVSGFAVAMFRLGERLFSSLRAGAIKDVSAEVTASEAVDSKWGAVVEAGGARFFAHDFGLALYVRYTHLDVAYQGETTAANSIGAVLVASFGD